MNNFKDISLMYVSCFTYKTLWEPFFKLKNKYFGENTMKVYFCIDELKNNYNLNINNINLLNFNNKSNFTINGNLFDRYLYYLENNHKEW